MAEKLKLPPSADLCTRDFKKNVTDNLEYQRIKVYNQSIIA